MNSCEENIFGRVCSLTFVLCTEHSALNTLVLYTLCLPYVQGVFSNMFEPSVWLVKKQKNKTLNHFWSMLAWIISDSYLQAILPRWPVSAPWLHRRCCFLVLWQECFKQGGEDVFVFNSLFLHAEYSFNHCIHVLFWACIMWVYFDVSIVLF